MPSADYFRLPYLSSHALSDFILRGPRYYNHTYRLNDGEALIGRHLDLGTAVHHGVEHRDPSAVADRYGVVPAEYITAGGALSQNKAAREWAEDHDVSQMLTPMELAKVEGCVRNILSHEPAFARLSGSTPEVVAIDEDLGIKGCADEVTPDHITDIKTGKDPIRVVLSRLEEAKRWIETRAGLPSYFVAYFIQAGQYSMLWPGRSWAWVYVERDTELHEVCLIELHEDTRAMAIQFWRECYAALRDCERNDAWEADHVATL